MNQKLKPEHLKAWRLFLTASARLVDRIDNDLRLANQLPLNWYDVLIELHEAPGNRLRMHDLAERVLLTRSGLTRLVDRLEKEGFLTREIDPEDRRGFYAIITESGIEALRNAWTVYAAGIDDFFAKHLSDDDAVLLSTVFSRMLAEVTSQSVE